MLSNINFCRDKRELAIANTKAIGYCIQNYCAMGTNCEVYVSYFIIKLITIIVGSIWRWS